MKCVLILAALLLQGPCLAAPNKQRDPEQIGQRNVGGRINLYSQKTEFELGKDMARDFEREVDIITDPVVSEYVNRIGQNIVRHSDAKIFFTIKVVRSTEVNAVAIPGGFVFVNSALIRTAGTEAELASALAHEIAHVAARHFTRRASLEQVMSCATIPLVFIGGWPGYAIQQAANLALPLAGIKFSRSAEAEADMLGLQYVYQSGYDPAAFIDLFERISVMEKSNPGIFARMLSSHPPVRNRIRSVQKQIERDLRPRDEYLVQTSEFQNVKTRLIAIENRERVPWVSVASPAALDARPVLRRRN
jgi:predicted Zn-dependent protease